MFGISFSEIILILLISFLIFGPQQLPAIAQKLGALIANLQQIKHNLSANFYAQSGLQQITSIRNEMEHSINQIRRHIQPYTIQPKKNNPILEPGISTATITGLNHETNTFLNYHQPELNFERQPELFDE
jgi:Sec-independent protein translocase protein TatA